jgi:hypothetical protein
MCQDSSIFTNSLHHINAAHTHKETPAAHKLQTQQDQALQKRTVTEHLHKKKLSDTFQWLMYLQLATEGNTI